MQEEARSACLAECWAMVCIGGASRIELTGKTVEHRDGNLVCRLTDC
jgi:hypothetical protein